MRFLKLPFIYWLLLNCIPFIGFELHSGNIKPGVFFLFRCPNDHHFRDLAIFLPLLFYQT